MTMATGKWQQPQKQRPHQRQKQWPSGNRETGSGGGRHIGIKVMVMAMTRNEDYNAGWALCH